MSGVVLSATSHVQSGSIVTDVEILAIRPGFDSPVEHFTMDGGVVGGVGLWTESYSRVVQGDFIVAPVVDAGGVAMAAAAPDVAPSQDGRSVSLLTGDASSGYIYDGIHWARSSLPVSFRVNTAGLPAGAAAAIAAAAQTWEDDPGSNMDFAYAGTTSLTPVGTDGQNVIGIGSLQDSTIARCSVWYSALTKEISEFDIAYNSNDSFVIGTSSGSYDVQGIATRELGHTLHLSDLYDPADQRETMYGYSSTGDTSHRQLGLGDRAGIRAIYPAAAMLVNLSGRTIDEFGRIAPSVRVEAGGTVTNSDSAGNYSIQLPSGINIVTYSADGFRSQTVELDLWTSQTRDVVLTYQDLTPPVTTSDAQPSYVGTATIHLSASDGASGCGVARTCYTVDGGATCEGTTITVAGLGVHTITFWSVDLKGNVEQRQTVQVSIAPRVFRVSTVTVGSGSMSPGGIVDEASSFTFTITPGLGQHLVGIRVDPTGSWLSERDGTYTLANITRDTIITAEFSPDLLTARFSATVGGTIVGPTSQVIPYGGGCVSVTAVADLGHHFVRWSDGVVTATRADANVTTSKSASAEFAVDTHTLAYIAGIGGTVSGATLQVVSYGGTGIAVTPTPDAGYHFVRWSDGSTASPRADVGVTSDKSVTAEFALNPYRLTYTAGTHGAISGEASQTVLYLSSGAGVWAVPDTGYHFVSWSDGSTRNPRTDTAVSTDASVTAIFAANVVPPAVYTPVAPSTMYRTKSYTVYAYLKPRHTAGSYPIRLYKERLVSGAWRSYGYVNAKASNYSTYTKCSASLKLPYTGRWRIRAYAPADAGHSATWSGAYDYVTVR